MRVLPILAVAALLLVALDVGCLITKTIQFPVRHTAPLLVEATATPLPWAVVVVDTSLQGMTYEFSANVISADEQAGEGPFMSVTPALLLDYGVSGLEGRPYQWSVIFGYSVDPATLDETDRRVSVTWDPQQYPLQPGCHTATLMVAHLWDEVLGCPKCVDDWGSITWQVFVCDKSQPGSCDSIPAASCPVTTTSPTSNSCEAYLLANDAGAECPESADAGSP